MPANVGSQTIAVKFFDPVNNTVVNDIGTGVRKIGIYSGGYLTKISDASVSLTVFDCEITDGTVQVRGFTGAAVTVAISAVAPVIVLRWVYTGSAAADYIDFVNVTAGSVLSTDVVVGTGTYVGPTLQATFDYTLRTNPDLDSLNLKVEPTVAASMVVRVRGGKASYGASNFTVVDQATSTFVAPVSGSRIDVIYVDNDGVVKVIAGTPAGSPTVPDFQQKAALAYLTIPTGSTSITASMITDVRPRVNAREAVLLTGAQTAAGVKTFTSFPITPSSDPSASYEVANKQYVDRKTKKTLFWYIPGISLVATNVSLRIKLDYAITIVKAKAYAKTAPTGANLIFDINVNGTSIWNSNPSNRLKITAGANEDTDTTTFDTTSVAANLPFTIDIDQIGSTIAGADLSVGLEVTLQ